MLYTRTLASGTEKEFHWHESPTTGLPTYITMSPAQAHGHFKTATLTSANTVIIVQPKPGLSVWVTDIIVTGESQASSTATIQFTDGSDTVIMIVAFQVKEPPQVNANLQAYFKGWKDARVELVTSGAADATATIGYIHSVDAPSFAEWDAER